MAIERVIMQTTESVTLLDVVFFAAFPSYLSDVTDVAFKYRIDDGDLLTTAREGAGAKRSGGIRIQFAKPTKVYLEGIVQTGNRATEIYYTRSRGETFRIPFPSFSSVGPTPPVNPLLTGDLVFALSSVSSGGYDANSVYYRRSGVDTKLVALPASVTIVDMTIDRTNEILYALDSTGQVYSLILGDTSWTTPFSAVTNLARIAYSDVDSVIIGVRFVSLGANNYVTTYTAGGTATDLAGPIDILNIKPALDESNRYSYHLTNETGGGSVGIRYVDYDGGAGIGRNGAIAGELFAACGHASGSAKLFYNNSTQFRFNTSTAPPTFLGASILGVLSPGSINSGSYDPVGDDLIISRPTGIDVIDATAGTLTTSIGTFNSIHAEVY